MRSIFELVKPFGRFQQLNTLILAGLSLISALHFYVQVFNMAEPALHCRPKQAQTYQNQTLETKCIMWNNYSRSIKLGAENSSSSSQQHYTCEFRDVNYNRTAINDWGLVCEKHTLVFQSQTIFFVGSICILFNGYITDRLGRKRTCTFFMISMCVVNLIYQVFVVDPSSSSFFTGLFLNLDVDVKFMLYCVYQFIAGFLVYSLYASAYVMAVEFTNNDYHTLVANIILLAFVIGELILLLVFYVTRNWIETNWFITFTTFVSTFFFILLVPESPRYVFKFFLVLFLSHIL